jgi:Na+/H+-dicarboxylate symporter
MNANWLLTILIMAALVLGVIVGHLMYDPNFDVVRDAQSQHAHATALQIFDFLGSTVFMGLLKMLIIPLIASSVIVGVTSVGDFSKLGRMGAITLFYYFSTMFVAVIIGLVAVSIVKPGVPLSGTLQAAEYVPDEAVRAKAEEGLIGVAENLVSQMIPTNIVEAMAAGQPLGVITFSIFFGVVVTLVGEAARPVVQFANGVFEVLMRMVQAIMWLAPIGVFALLAWTVARIGLDVFLGPIRGYIFVVLGGLALHGLGVLPLVLWIFGRTNPYRFLHQMRQAMLTALATDSSSATLPVTIECATEVAGVSKRVAGFVLPLGSTVNMDGTALYEAVAVVFMAQAFGIELSLAQLVIVALTATLAAVGAAGIPSAGLVTMVIVVDAVNNSLGATATALIPIGGIGLIIGVDRLLDMFRTVVNVWGDAVGAKIVDRVMPDE